MSISFSQFPGEVAALQQLAEAYRLFFRMPSDSEVLMVGADFVISVAIDNDGAAINYYDAANEASIVEYAVGFLLFRLRNPVAIAVPQYPSNTDRVRYKLQWAISVLSNYGVDVLSGSRDWFHEYTLETTVIQGGLRDRMVTALHLRRAASAEMPGNLLQPKPSA